MTSKTAQAVMDFIDYAQAEICPAVIDVETGRFLDWGQAIAREVYGPQEFDNAPAEPSDAVYAIISRWKEHSFPAWMRIGIKIEGKKTE